MERKHVLAIGGVLLVLGVATKVFDLTGSFANEAKSPPTPNPNGILPDQSSPPRSEVTPIPGMPTPDPASPEGWACLRVQNGDPHNDYLDGDTTNDLPDRPLRIIRDLRGLPPGSVVEPGQGPYRVIARNGNDTTSSDYGFIRNEHGYVYAGDLVCITESSISGTIFDANANVPLGFDQSVLKNIQSTLAETGYQLAN